MEEGTLEGKRAPGRPPKRWKDTSQELIQRSLLTDREILNMNKKKLDQS